MRRIRELADDPVVLGRFSGFELLFWLLAAGPIVVWLNDSVQFLVFISVYAIIRTAFADWQSYRAERRGVAAQDTLVDRINEVTPNPD